MCFHKNPIRVTVLNLLSAAGFFSQILCKFLISRLFKHTILTDFFFEAHAGLIKTGGTIESSTVL